MAHGARLMAQGTLLLAAQKGALDGDRDPKKPDLDQDPGPAPRPQGAGPGHILDHHYLMLLAKTPNLKLFPRLFPDFLQ